MNLGQKLNDTAFPSRPIALCWGISLAIELLLCLSRTHGTLVLALDDPYIHIDLARRIRILQYGFNPGEFATPSSSVLWPFVLALTPVPFDWLASIALVYNAIAFLAIPFVLGRLLEGIKLPVVAWISLALAFCLASNMVAVVFIGMEHGFEVFIAACALLVLRHNMQREEHCVWAYWAVGLGPLIRYELLAVTLPVLAYAALRRAPFKHFVIPAFCLSILSLFSLSLALHHFGYLPSSVIAHTTTTGDTTFSVWLSTQIKRQVSSYKFHPIACLTLGIMATAAASWRTPHRQVADFAVLMAVLGHIILGQYGLLNRYVGYLEAYLCFWLSFRALSMVQHRKLLTHSRYIGSITAGLAVLAGPFTLYGLKDARVVWGEVIDASTAIYEQQYQMGRFLAERWDAPVGANDIGLVGYWSENYVLDFAGLANFDALRRVKHPTLADAQPSWMAVMAKQRNVDLAMIYPDWFKPMVPASWITVAKMTTACSGGTPANRQVTFFATNPQAVKKIQAALLEFSPALMDKDRLEVLGDDGALHEVIPLLSDPCGASGAGSVLNALAWLRGHRSPS